MKFQPQSTVKRWEMGKCYRFVSANANGLLGLNSTGIETEQGTNSDELIFRQILAMEFATLV